MAAVTRFQCELSGFQGGPGVNTWFFADASFSDSLGQATIDGIGAALVAFYTEVDNLIQGDVLVTVQPEAASVDIPSGQIVNIQTAQFDPATVDGAGNTPAAHFLMAKVQNRTGVFEDGRELRGGIFFGPLSGGNVTGGGSLEPIATTALGNALETLYSSVNTAGGLPVVYRRPRPASSPLGPRAGSAAAVSRVSVWNQPAVLRSRRD